MNTCIHPSEFDLIFLSLSFLFISTRHRIVLNVTDAGSNRYATTSLMVNVLSGYAPTVQLRLVTGRSGRYEKVDAGGRVMISGTVNSNGAVALRSEWSKISDQSFNPATATALSQALLTPTTFLQNNQFSTVIRPMALLTNEKYIFRLSSTTAYGTGFADISVITNSPPSIGQLTVNPAQGR